MAVRFTTRQMLRLTTDLAMLAAMPIVILRFGGWWSFAAVESLVLAMTAPRIRRNLIAVRRKQSAIQQTRRQVIAELRQSKAPIASRGAAARVAGPPSDAM